MSEEVSSQRSKNMRAIKGKDTSIELKVRKYLYHHGFRYRKNVKDLPGKPDIVIDKYHTVIFVNGCFWHHHYNCKRATLPKSHQDYWLKKIDRNVENDIKNTKLLEQMDYHVITIWECEINEAFEDIMQNVIDEILSFNDDDE
ncbi:MAG: very short patch repair endonuclease [Anaerobutyricum hallii]|jgi:DNA mismatch endonuclease (patch repair protein)|uniref:very short patch repair endonuclease n=1 Tax=Anaerobutyricum hallii TaxID=39488 RepID=UPI000EE45E26|nr:very short patch repair endonuclease [Anaerobutyricum hallii]MDD6588397.1 very short patch repair endonuclease [Anaerobutyricum hallii]HAN57804.1 very short patch repair endonuclease [Erysipelotrichaceae bacterium]